MGAWAKSYNNGGRARALAARLVHCVGLLDADQQVREDHVDVDDRNNVAGGQLVLRNGDGRRSHLADRKDGERGDAENVELHCKE